MTIVQALRLNRAFTSLLLGALVTLGAAPATPACRHHRDEP